MILVVSSIMWVKARKLWKKDRKEKTNKKTNRRGCKRRKNKKAMTITMMTTKIKVNPEMKR